MVAQEQIMEWVRHPDLLDKESLYELRKVVNAYPYYQLARILFLKNLYLLNMPDFKEELKKGVLYVADVSMLFYYLEGEKFSISRHYDQEEHTKYSESDRTLDLIDNFLKDEDEPTAEEVQLIPEVPVDYTSLLMKEEGQKEAVPLMKGHDLIDDFLRQAEEDKHPLYRLEPEETKEKTSPKEHKVETPEVTNEDITFLKTEGDVVKNIVEEDESPVLNDDEDVDDDVQDEVAEDSSFSETLAKIYVKQQKYDKALEIIKKLNLKYPKKNAYFADQIRFLEKLIINTKSK